jgi:hypothetical protein
LRSLRQTPRNVQLESSLLSDSLLIGLFCDMLLQRAWCYMQLKSFHQASLDLTAVIALESAPPAMKAKVLSCPTDLR